MTDSVPSVGTLRTSESVSGPRGGAIKQKEDSSEKHLAVINVMLEPSQIVELNAMATFEFSRSAIVRMALKKGLPLVRAELTKR